MTDYNILNRASFDDIQKSFIVQVPPFLREGSGVLDLGGPDNVFWIKKITWEYKYIDIGVPNARQTKILPIDVTVANILQSTKRALPPFIEPRPVVAKVPFSVVNTNISNNHKLEVEFYLDGVLVIPKPNTEPLTLKQMKAYIMMDSNTRGTLAIEEDANDQLNETLVKLGLPSLRDILPGGMAALKTLPGPLQSAVFNALITKNAPDFIAPMLTGGSSINGQPMLALPNSDPHREQSSFIGDMIASWPDEVKNALTNDQLKKLAVSMVEKGWRRV